MRKLFANMLLCAAGLLPLSSFAAFEQCKDYFPNQAIPPIALKANSSLRPLCFNSFAVLYSGQTKTPYFTVEKLNRARLADAQDEERTNRFYEEARLPSAERARLEDYKGSGYDRGHMAPAADMPDASAMAQSFSLANMVPQAPENNRGIWAKQVESATRKYVMRASGDVFVFTGPYFQGPLKTIGPNKVAVPTHLFKLVYDQQAQKAWAFWVENTNEARMSRPISYQELTNRLGYELLPGISVR